MMDMSVTEVGELAAAAIADIVGRAVGGRIVSEYVESDPVPWAIFENGGWDVIGVSDSEGGGGATLRDLVEVASRWGAWCVPLPLLETIIARRWSVAARETPGPVTVAVASTGTGEGAGLAPFGALPGVAIARSLGSETDGFKSSDDALPEPFAAGLRAAVVPWVTELPAAARHELDVVWAAEVVGAAQRLLDQAVDYAKQRVQFGRPIGSFQAVKHLCAEMLLDLESARAAASHAASAVDTDHLAEAAAVAKVCCSEAYVRIAGDSLHIHGGLGFTWDHDAHLYLRRARSSLHLFGDPRHHRERLARHLGLSGPAAVPWRPWGSSSAPSPSPPSS